MRKNILLCIIVIYSFIYTNVRIIFLIYIINDENYK